MLIRGDRLNERQKRMVLSAFIYRWTKDNHRREEVYRGIFGKPTIPLVSDAQWLKEHAFHFVRDGSRLMANRHYAEPAFMTENNPVNPKRNPSSVRVYDNGGKTADRYTLVIPGERKGFVDMWGFNAYPFHPQGIGMYAGDYRMMGSYSHLGKLVSVSSLPEQAQKFVHQTVKEAGKKIPGKWKNPVSCRCCGKPVYNTDGYPIHTKCIPTHWGKHAHGINTSRCKEFGHKAKKNPGLKTFDDIKVLKSKPKNWSHMLPVHARENRMGHMTITFSDGTSIYAQSDYDIDSTVDSMARIGSQYYILDEHGWTF